MPALPRRRPPPDLMLIGFLLIFPLVMFHQQTLGDRTLLPTENLFQYLPHSVYREAAGAPALPHNHLLSDLVLQNYQWKTFIREQIALGEIPLWNPHILSGQPFFAAGLHSMLYPLSVLYYALPLPSAYGWFILINLWLAGLFMAGYLRALGVNRYGAALGGLVYQLSGSMIAGAVFPMIVAGTVWLPLILWMIENILRGRHLWLFRGTAIPWVGIGAIAIACNFLAGHVEISIYTLMIIAWYGTLRLARECVTRWRAAGRFPWDFGASNGAWLLTLALLGLGLAALQILPTYEFVRASWRVERNSLETVLGYAHPPRDIVQFLLPNFYGNPAHHSYFDVFKWEQVTDLRNAAGEAITVIDWGIKNYVEAALYLGTLPLILSAIAIAANFKRRLGAPGQGGIVAILVMLAVLALSFMFGTPAYVLIFELPGMNQLNSPFRWVLALSLAVAALSGMGLHHLSDRAGSARSTGKLIRRLGILLASAALAVFIACAFCFLAYERVSPLFDWIVANMAKADGAFADGRMFFSYLLPQVLLLGMWLALGGLALLGAARARSARWALLALLITSLDLLAAGYGFNPASDPRLLDYRPPAVEFLLEQEGRFRINSLERDPSRPAILHPNMGMSYGLEDVRGYDSIIPQGYVATMRALHPQRHLAFNRISPVYTSFDGNHPGGYAQELNADLFNLLNIRFVLTPRDWQSAPAAWHRVYSDDAVSIWENGSFFPRAFTVAKSDWDASWLAEPGRSQKAGESSPVSSTLRVERYQEAAISRDSAREKFIDVSVAAESWLVVSETYMPGWRAFIRPWSSGEAAEASLPVQRVLATLQGVELPAGHWTVRLVYSPESVHLGMFGSTISVALIVLLAGLWFWRAYIGLNSEGSSGVAKVARNSLAPIILNLFNRGIDFALAMVMYRLLSQEEMGIYSFAIVLFVAFDIFTNFGLDLFLIREASRQRHAAGHYLYNSSLFRFVLSLAGAPLLAGALLLWQGSGVEAISADGMLAIGLLYIGLFPASLSKGMTALFYANEQAERPAAIATITTMIKAVFGVIALLLGYGIVGLAAVSIFNNILTLVVLVWAGRRLIGSLRRWRPDGSLIRNMVGESFPLMLNHFLATIFFQVDIVILQAIRGAQTVAQYSTGYKWLLAINIVPAFFTQALFPVMSRQARDDLPALRRSYSFGIKLLFAVTLPLAALLTILAEPLTLLLGGTQYLPQGAIALQLMIWSIPFGWMNSLTQYLLVALGRQVLVTRAFALAVGFNLVANCLFIPQYGFQAAALTTIASEVVLLLPFMLLLRGALPGVNVLSLLWRPLLAFCAMLLMLAILGQGLGSLLMATLVYGAALLLLKPLNAEEGAILLASLPDSLRRMRLLRWVAAG